MSNKNIVAYALSVAAVALLAVAMRGTQLLNQAAPFYWSFAFFACAALDAYRTRNTQDVTFAKVWRPRGLYLENGVLQVGALGDYIEVEEPVAQGSTFVDRCLGYLFVAPLILPAEIYRAVKN
ncbi:MAG: hypothetical protein ACREMY_06525 [bacterium]